MTMAEPKPLIETKPLTAAPEAVEVEGVVVPSFVAVHDADAFLAAAYRAHFVHVWHTLRRLGVASRDLEDAAQEVFIVAHRRLDTFDNARSVRPWLSGIAWRVASDERKRARNRREYVGILAEPAGHSPDASEQLAAAQTRALVHRALAEIPEDQRIVFIMHELDGFSMPEIRDALDAPLNTLYSRLRLARRKFKAAATALQAKGGAQ